MALSKKWKIKTVDNEALASLSTELGLSTVTASILYARGLSEADSVKSFMNPSLSGMPDPVLLKGVDKAVSRLCQARLKRERICVYGDYDVDGIAATALLISFFRQLGMECHYFIPNRFDDGYGLNSMALEQIMASGATLIISVDCGITAVSEARLCLERGIDLIITDHHSPKESIPEACAVINPLQPGCAYPFKYLSGVGVAFNLLVALRSSLRNQGAFADKPEPDLRQWLDLVALGTIADVVPLVNQNRVYVYHGLKQLSLQRRPGLEALKRVSGINDTVSCGQVGFRLAPRLNAAGRLESALSGVELLLVNDPQLASGLAGELDAANAERQAIERSILEEAIEMVESGGGYPARRSIVLASAAWHQGVVGIVASRLVERYHRPVILIALDQSGNGKGSGRSISGFHMLEALNACSQNLERFGGHRHAAGVTINADQLSAFSAAFEKVASDRLTEDDLTAFLDIDAVVSPQAVNVALVDELKRLEPFGSGNPEPTLMMRSVRVVNRRIVGDGHLKLVLEAEGVSFNAIAFRQAECNTDGLLDLAFYPEINLWNNSATLQLRIKNIRPAETT